MAKPFSAFLIMCGVPGAAAVAFIEELRWLGALLIVAGFGLCALWVLAMKRIAPDRNARRQRQVMEDGHAAAAGHGLGAFIALRQAEWTVPGDWHSEYLAAVPVLVLLATPPGAMLAGRAALWWLGALISVIGMTAGWLSARWQRKETARCFLRYEHGFVLRSEKAVHAFRLADIAEVIESTRKKSYQGHHFVIKYYELRAVDGRRARIKGEEFGAVILGSAPPATIAIPPPPAPRATGAIPATAGAGHPGAVPARIARLAGRLGIGEPRGSHARRGRSSCYLYTGGLILTGLLGGVRAFAAWDDAACIYWQRRGTMSAYQVRVLRRGQSGLSISLGSALGQELVRLQTAAVLPGLAARLTAGETLRFGPFRMGTAGVDDGSGTVPWDEITGCDTVRDRIGIARLGQPHQVRVVRKHVPDVLVFEQLVQAFADRPWTGAPASQAAVTGPGDGHTVRGGWRERLLTALTPLAISRLAVALGGGAALALAGLIWYALPPASAERTGVLLLVGTYLPVAAGIGYGLASTALWRVARALTSTLAAGRPPDRRRRLAIGAAVTVATGIALWRAGPGALLDGLAVTAITALPALLVFAIGGWAYLLTLRRVRSWRHRWLRHLADLPTAGAVGVGVLQLFHRDLLAHQPAAAVFFPLGAWCGFWIWRSMGRSPRLAVRAGADIVLSLLLGADLVLFLVWMANLLGLSEPEVAVLRGALERAGAVADLPWWLWLGLLVLLAAASLAFAIWPGRLRPTIRWSVRLHVVTSVDAGKRLLTGVHIGLLVIVGVGLSAPPGLDTTLRGPLRTNYTVTVQRELDGAGERAAYAAIQREFSPAHGQTPTVNTLTAIVSQIHSTSTSTSTSTEDDLARRVGQIQAAALGLSSPPQVRAAAIAAAAAAGLGPPVGDTSGLSERLDELSARQRQADAVKRQVNQAGDLAAAAASAMSIPGIGDHEIVQVIREYLSGLVEDSPLKDVFAAWATRLVSRITPPPAAGLVVPDPGQLELAAAAALDDERAKAGFSGPAATDPATLTSSAVAAAVELADQARLVAEGNTSCYECAQSPGAPDEPADRPNEPVEDHPVEPHDFVP
jgi:hypothetical protein